MRRINGLTAGCWLGFLLLLRSAATDVVIHEIHFHPHLEDTGGEFIELYNAGKHPVSLNGWRFSKGIAFAFSNKNIGPGEFLVVAAAPELLSAQHKNLTNRILGPWTGSLADGGEDVRLEDSGGNRVDELHYHDEGDWAVRVQTNLSGLPSWSWLAAADGAGPSLERINTTLPSRLGGNWKPSTVPGGTPGRSNSLTRLSPPPLIDRVKHHPARPRSFESVRITSEFHSLPGRIPSAQVHFRLDSDRVFTTVPMSMAQSVEGYVGHAILPPRDAGSVVEYFVSATHGPDEAATTWPAPSLARGAQIQGPNALYGVSDEVSTNDQPFVTLVMRAEDRNRFHTMSRQIDAVFPAAWVHEFAGKSEIRQGVGIRYRGNSSRSQNPPSFRLQFRDDEPWKGMTSANLNAQETYNQVAGSALLRQAGVPALKAAPIQLRFSTNDATRLGDPPLGTTYRSYALLETPGSDFVQGRFPDDDEGNLYRGVEHLADLRYLGTNANRYQTAYSKQTRVDEQDYSDIIGLTFALATNGPALPAMVSQHANIDEWLTSLASDLLLGNQETTLGTGNGDDYFLYRGTKDTRFILSTYDLDTVLGTFGSAGVPSDIYPAGRIPALRRLLTHPEIQPRYHAELWRLATTVFSDANVRGVLHQHLGSWVPTHAIHRMLNSVSNRTTWVLRQIPARPPAPHRMPVSFPSKVPVLNEIFAQGNSVHGNDRIELFHSESQDLDLSGVGISDQADLPYRYRFPPGTILRAGEHMVLWADRARQPPGIHLGFGLDGDGDDLFVTGPAESGGERWDEVHFGVQLDDWTIGRTSSGEWSLGAMTLGRQNEPSELSGPESVRINEWLAEPDDADDPNVSGRQFIELYNPSSLPADLSGVALTENVIGSPRQQPLIPLTFVAPGGFCRLRSAAGDRVDGDEFAFHLGSDVGEIGLVDFAGVAMDVVLRRRAIPGVSEGRFPDGSNSFLLMRPTEGSTNRPAVVWGDFDADGLNDFVEWSSLRTRNPDTAQDNDGDGLSDADELGLRLDPLDPELPPRWSFSVHPDGAFARSFVPRRNWNYQILATESLENSVWAPWTNITALKLDVPWIFSPPVNPTTHRWFRIQATWSGKP